MEIVDEILTPGCPNCAIKHLSAAVTYIALDSIPDYDLPVWAVNEARARINAVEFLEGYTSHFELAVGFMELAEEEACSVGSSVNARVIRERRVKLMMSKDAKNVSAFVASIAPGCKLMATAHIAEALREMPNDDKFRKILIGPIGKRETKAEVVACLRSAIEHVRREYFDLPEPAVGEGEQENKGETDMATTKKTPAKKATCGACKGGKTAAKAPAKKTATKDATKAACKGGKCNKKCK